MDLYKTFRLRKLIFFTNKIQRANFGDYHIITMAKEKHINFEFA